MRCIGVTLPGPARKEKLGYRFCGNFSTSILQSSKNADEHAWNYPENSKICCQGTTCSLQYLARKQRSPGFQHSAEHKPII